MSACAARLLPALLLPLLAGCAGPQLMLLAWEPRAKPEQGTTCAVMATALQGPAWAWADPASVASNLTSHYRPPIPGLGERVAPAAAAPGELAQALAGARDVLHVKGYRLAPEGAPAADLVVLVSLSHGPDGRLVRAAVHVGGLLDERFRPDLFSLAAVVPPEADPVDPAELVAALLDLLPEREEPEE